MCLQSYCGAVITDWVILVLVFCFSLHVKRQQFKVFWQHPNVSQVPVRWILFKLSNFKSFSKIFQNQGLCLKSQMGNPNSHQMRMCCVSAPMRQGSWSAIWMPPDKIPQNMTSFFWLYTMTITSHSVIGGWLGVSERPSFCSGCTVECLRTHFVASSQFCGYSR